MKCQIDEYLFSSDFDSGNCERVEKINDPNNCPQFNLHTKSDCQGTKFEAQNHTWFYFSIKGGKQGKIISITLSKLRGSKKLYLQGMKPVCKIIPSNPKWRRIKTSLVFIPTDDTYSITFKHKFENDDELTYFAYCYPFGYDECQSWLDELDAKYSTQYATKDTIKTDLLYHREWLTTSVEGKRIDLLTISSTKNANWDCREKQIENLFPEQKERPFTFLNKPVYFLTARVHPGETPGAHIFNGFVKFILSDDPRAKMLLDKFVFKLIPMLNPDGVAVGHYRHDTQGINLNRMYTNPSLKEHPAIYATKKILLQLHEQKSLKFYVDLHGHASKKGCFIYGNYLKDSKKHISNLLYPKLVALNTQHFDFQACNFTQRNMYSKDRLGQPKTGAGRVALYLETGLIHCYTVECNYNTGKRVNNLCVFKSSSKNLQELKPFRKPPNYTINVLHDIGRGLAIAALDFIDYNPHSRLANSSFRSVTGLKDFIKKTYEIKKGKRRKIKKVGKLNCKKQKKESVLPKNISIPKLKTSSKLPKNEIKKSKLGALERLSARRISTVV